MSALPDKPTLSVAETAPLLRLSTSGLYAQVNQGTCPIPHITIGRRKAFRTIDVAAFLGVNEPTGVEISPDVLSRLDEIIRLLGMLVAAQTPRIAVAS